MSIIDEYKVHDKILIAVDCIIFGFDGKDLQVLLIKRAFEPEIGKWSLMGGFVTLSESSDDGAYRILKKLTGLSNIYMEQLYCFADVNRDPGGRVISIAYFALIKIDDYSEKLMNEYNAKWYNINSIPALIFDHEKMILMGKERLKQKVAAHPIGFALLPEKFTLSQLQNLYEAIYEISFDKRNFLRKILSLGILIKLNEKEKLLSKKGSFYYRFDFNKYKKLDQEGLKFI
ncbi:MAG TPA: NUDIX domain-containing protein [Hanamia sp.]|nr:NUDIX domain-containing protein [Hanamia sp.]